MTPTQRAIAIAAASAIQGVEPALLTQDDLDALAAFVAHCTANHARASAGRPKVSPLTRQEQNAERCKRYRAKNKQAKAEIMLDVIPELN